MAKKIAMWPTPRAEERCQYNRADKGMALSRAHPDEALMHREPYSKFDILADKMGWYGKSRKDEEWIYSKLGTCSRMAWLENQVVESLKTESAPLRQMTPQETSWFLGEIARRKEARNKRREYEERKKQQEATP